MYNDFPVNITGVMADIPENTHLHAGMFLSYSTLKAMGKSPQYPWNQWGDDMTYILLNKNAKPDSIVPQLNKMLAENGGEWLSSRTKFELQPLSKIHWDTETRGDVGRKGNKAYIYIFLSAAIFILIIACFNFMNLSISKYIDRMKEVGVRKVAGAHRKQLIRQFMTESFLVILMSVLIATVLFSVFYSGLYTYLNTDFIFNKYHFIALLLIITGTIIGVGIIAGGYPALFISKYNPVEIFRNQTGKAGKKLTLRKILVMLQFSISIILLVGTIVIFRQLNYMKNSDLGFNKEDVVLLSFIGSDNKKVIQKYDLLRNELLKDPKIQSVSGAYTIPGINSQMNISITPEGESAENSVNIQALPADFGFAKAMGLQIVEGRDFSEEFPSDRYESVLINQAAVTSLGLKKPIGTKLKIPGDEFKNGVRIVGVLKDFHIKSFQSKISPVLVYINPNMYMNVAIRITQGNETASIDQIKTVWNKIFPDIPVNPTYLKDVYNGLYSSEEKTGKLLSVFTALALFISCLGLFGFASYTVSKRVKEVGIRKVLGAKASRISFLLSGQFTILVLFSGFIAIPIAYWLVNKWLQNFAFRVSVAWWVFFAAVFFEILVALITVGWQSWRAATRNPVEALRYE